MLVSTLGIETVAHSGEEVRPYCDDCGEQVETVTTLFPDTWESDDPCATDIALCTPCLVSLSLELESILARLPLETGATS